MTLRFEALVSTLTKELDAVEAERQKYLTMAEQLGQEAAQLRQALAAMGQGAAPIPAQVRSSGAGGYGSLYREKQILREMVARHLKGHPEGLSSVELVANIMPEWHGQPLTAGRISMLCRNDVALTGTPARWVYVPTEGEVGSEEGGNA